MTTVYNIELDWIIIEKIVMRAVLAAVAYQCVIIQIYNPYHLAVTHGTPDLYVLQKLFQCFFLVIIHIPFLPQVKHLHNPTSVKLRALLQLIHLKVLCFIMLSHLRNLDQHNSLRYHYDQFHYILNTSRSPIVVLLNSTID